MTRYRIMSGSNEQKMDELIAQLASRYSAGEAASVGWEQTGIQCLQRVRNAATTK